MSAEENRTVYFKGQFYSLSPLEYAVFTLLILYEGEILCNDKLLRDVRGYMEDMSITAHNIEACMLRLRNMFGSDRVQSVNGQGYRLVP